LGYQIPAEALVAVYGRSSALAAPVLGDGQIMANASGGGTYRMWYYDSGCTITSRIRWWFDSFLRLKFRGYECGYRAFPHSGSAL